jgi:quercetin 2,3-dioxygenase
VIHIIRSDERHRMEAGWLTTYWHFSFSQYYDPRNMHWGALRVFNDDWIQADSGFPMHPHDNMEIITYVIEGELTHKDSLGNTGVIQPGEVQRMTAGSGIVHSEYNASPDTPVHLLQMWLFPNRRDLTPSWEQKPFTLEQRQGTLLPVVSGSGEGGTLAINQSATFYVSALAPSDTVTHYLGPDRHGYLFVIEGEVDLNGQTLRAGDQARIKDEERLTITATASTELVLWDSV